MNTFYNPKPVRNSPKLVRARLLDKMMSSYPNVANNKQKRTAVLRPTLSDTIPVAKYPTIVPMKNIPWEIEMRSEF